MEAVDGRPVEWKADAADIKIAEGAVPTICVDGDVHQCAAISVAVVVGLCEVNKHHGAVAFAVRHRCTIRYSMLAQGASRVQRSALGGGR